MKPFAVSVISMSPEAVRLPAVSPVKPPPENEKEPSPLSVISPPPPTVKRLKFPPASMLNGTPRMPKVQAPSSPMWMLALSRALAVALLDSVMVRRSC
jgi:hypothetical protein